MKLKTRQSGCHYRIIDSAGRWLTRQGFTSYIHYDALKFNCFYEACEVAAFHKARVEYI